MHNPRYSLRHKVLMDLLRQFREEKGINQTELAALLGTTQSSIGKCERGERLVGFVQAEEWCKVLGVPFEEFVQIYLETPTPVVQKARRKSEV